MLRSWLLLASACSGAAARVIDAGDATVPGDGASTHHVAYVSGYATQLAWFDVQPSGVLAPVGTIASFAGSPSFLAIDPARTHLYAISESSSRLGAYAIDQATGALAFMADVASGGSGPAHVVVDPS